MTTAKQLLGELQAHGIDLQPHGDDLRFRPRDKITPAMLHALRQHKAELLAMLKPQQVQPDWNTTMRCPWCSSPRLLERRSGLWCGACERLAWQPTDTGGLVRCDAASLQIIDIPTPCPTCQGIVFWWDVAGGSHCEACSPCKLAAQHRDIGPSRRRPQESEHPAIAGPSQFDSEK